MRTEPPPEETATSPPADGRGNRWAAISNSVMVRFLLFFASGWAMVQLLAYFEMLLVVFVSSTFLAFLLNYPATWLSRWMPRTVAIVGLFLACLGILGGLALTLGLAVLSQGQQLVANLREFSDGAVVPWLADLETLFQTWNLPINLESLAPQLQTQALSALNLGLGLLQASLANLVLGIFIAVITLFMMLDGAKLWHWLLRQLPIRNKERFNTVVQQNLIGFFWGRIVLVVFVGLSTFVIFLVLGVPYALVLSTIVAVLDLIPGIGATLGIGLVSILLLSQSVWMAAQALVIGVLVQQVQENLLLPYVMKDSLNINPVVMFFALIVGARVAGIFGLFLAIPVAGVIITWLDIEVMQGKSA
ncbi:MAG: AI-2E family transporter [Nodosilinea sp.]